MLSGDADVEHDGPLVVQIGPGFATNISLFKTMDLPSRHFQHNTSERPDIRRSQSTCTSFDNLGSQVHGRTRQRIHDSWPSICIVSASGNCACLGHGTIDLRYDLGCTKINILEDGIRSQQDVCCQ